MDARVLSGICTFVKKHMEFLKMTCYGFIIKYINIKRYNVQTEWSTSLEHIIIKFHYYTTMGILSRNNQRGPSWGTSGFQNSAEVYNWYPHERTGLTSIPCAQCKGCLTSSNLSLNWPEYLMKGSTGARLVLVLPPTYQRHLLASLTDRPVTISY